MLNWYNRLYVGDNAKKKIEKYRKSLNRGKLVPGVYLITLAANEVDQLDIISSHYLIQNAVYRRCPMIVGVASGYKEALSLVIRMTEETFSRTGTANIKDYLIQR